MSLFCNIRPSQWEIFERAKQKRVLKHVCKYRSRPLFVVPSCSSCWYFLCIEEWIWKDIALWYNISVFLRPHHILLKTVYIWKDNSRLQTVSTAYAPWNVRVSASSAALSAALSAARLLRLLICPLEHKLNEDLICSLKGAEMQRKLHLESWSDVCGFPIVT